MSRRTGSALALAAILIATASSPARAAGTAGGGARVSATVDRAELARGERLLLTIRVESTEPPSQLELPEKGLDFEIVGRSQSQQTSVTFTGGAMQARHAVDWLLTLSPLRDGKLTIPPFAVTVGGERFLTDAIAVNVLRGGGKPGAAPAPPTGPSPGAGWRGWERDLWLEVQVDRRNPWLGEQVTASVFLVSPVGVSGIDGFKPPAYDGFWAESLEVPRQIEPTLRIVRGVPLRAFLIQRIALFPTRAGKAIIEPFQIDATVQLLSGNRLFSPFQSVEQVRRRSAPVELDVRPLPAGQRRSPVPRADPLRADGAGRGTARAPDHRPRRGERAGLVPSTAAADRRDAPVRPDLRGGAEAGARPDRGQSHPGDAGDP
jgi:hypothetical protein